VEGDPGFDLNAGAGLYQLFDRIAVQIDQAGQQIRPVEIKLRYRCRIRVRAASNLPDPASVDHHPTLFNDSIR
jgi:hypothetical protein